MAYLDLSLLHCVQGTSGFLSGGGNPQECQYYRGLQNLGQGIDLRSSRANRELLIPRPPKPSAKP